MSCWFIDISGYALKIFISKYIQLMYIKRNLFITFDFNKEGQVNKQPGLPPSNNAHKTPMPTLFEFLYRRYYTQLNQNQSC